ncbi:MAG: hypothetical protein ABI594_08890 [Ginsengibacter sp.]
MNSHLHSRRAIVKSSIFGLLAVSVPGIAICRDAGKFTTESYSSENPEKRYPHIDEAIVSEVVGVSHFNLDRLKELVNKRPELARATWDWAFGDWETALGAASHVGRRDIAEFLMRKGARPDIFTFAMLGAVDAVEKMIDAQPGIQAIAGPHGISLLQHAKNGLQSEGITLKQKKQSLKLIYYLEGLGNADVAEKYMKVEESEKEEYLGDYMYGDGAEDGFSVKLNMKKLISLGKVGKFGGALYQITKNTFIYNGTTSVTITFQVENNKVVSLTVKEPDLTVTARKV